MAIDPLEIEQATAYFDEEQQLIFVTYRGDLDGEVTVQVYEWIERLLETVGIDALNGEIFDFTAVTTFQDSNLQIARKVSRRMNLSMDTSQLPVALIVKDFYQEEILRGTMRIVPEQERKRIVNSEEEALAFIEEWYRQRS